MKRFLSILLVVILTFGATYLPQTTSSASAVSDYVSTFEADSDFAQVISAKEDVVITTKSECVIPAPSGSAPAPYATEMSPSFNYGISNSKLNIFKSLVESAVKNHASSLNIYEYKIPYNSYTGQMFFDTIFYNPEYFNIKTYEYYYSGDGYIYSIDFFYTMTKDTYLSRLKACEMVAEKLLEGITNSGLSDYAKALLLHDRIATWNEYDYEGLKIYKNWTDDPYTIYGALIKQKSVCQGYAMTYKYLLNKVGIKNYFCSSNTLNHAWNILIINGKSYHVDVTWDDPSVYDSASRTYKKVEGKVCHDNFLISTEKLKNTGHNATDYDSSPTDTTFDSFWWQNSNSEFILLKNKIYFLYNIKTAGQTPLVQVDGNLNSHTYIKYFNDKWYADSTHYYVNSFSRLSTDGTDLFVSGTDKIYKYNLSTGTVTVFSQPAQGIYGFKIYNNLILYTYYNGTGYINNQYAYKNIPSEEGINFSNGSWRYYKNGKYDDKVETLVKHEGKWYYVKNGIVDFSATTLCCYNGVWYYIQNGKVNFKATTLVKYGNTWYYVQNGVLRWGVNTLFKYGSTWYYIKNSQVDFGATTLFKYGNTWYYIQKGQIKWGVETLVNYGGTWYYVKDSQVNFNATTLTKYGNTWFYVQKGSVKWGVNTLVNYGGTWYYVKNSRVDFSYTGLDYFAGKWYYIQKGVLRWGVTTLVYHGGTWYYVKNSQINYYDIILFKYGNTTYFVRNGKVDFSYTGYVNDYGTRHYVKKGVMIW